MSKPKTLKQMMQELDEAINRGKPRKTDMPNVSPEKAAAILLYDNENPKGWDDERYR